MTFRSACIAGLLLASGSVASAQGGLTQCEFVFKGGFSSIIVGTIEVSEGRGITVNCRSKNIRLQADSGRKMGEGLFELFGRVHYSEPTRIDLRSDLLIYSLTDERVVARGNVVATLPSGSILRGPEATYLRALPAVRRLEELTAIRGPTLTIAARGDSAKPVTVNATTIFMRGDSLIYASRSVVITRTDVIARGDSAFLDGRVGTETMRLMFKPSIEGTSGRKFRLEGEIIDAYSRDRRLERVIARGKGNATSQDMNIVADTIDLRMRLDRLVRAYAWSRPGQARAASTAQVITADSIDVDMPAQRVRVVNAVGRARAAADADTLRFRTTEKDWLSGDTVTAWFDSTAVADTGSTPPITRILTRHRESAARAYYHLAANDTSLRVPAIGYVVGREIRLDFQQRRVARLNVVDSVTGLYLEPRRDTSATRRSGSPTPTPARPPGAEDAGSAAAGSRRWLRRPEPGPS